MLALVPFANALQRRRVNGTVVVKGFTACARE